METKWEYDIEKDAYDTDLKSSEGVATAAMRGIVVRRRDSWIALWMGIIWFAAMAGIGGGYLGVWLGSYGNSKVKLDALDVAGASLVGVGIALMGFVGLYLAYLGMNRWRDCIERQKSLEKQVSEKVKK